MNEPNQIRAGDTVTWQESFPDYPAPTWALKYRLVGTTNQAAVTASANGTGFKITIDKATTGGYPVGHYTLVGWVEKGSEQYTVSTTQVDVLPNLSSVSTGFDARSHVQRTLDLIETAIEAYAGKPVQVTINGRARTLDMPALIQMRSKYKWFLLQEKKAERSAKGLDAGGRILVTFRNSV